MATSTKLFLSVSWILSLSGELLAGISWRCPLKEMVSSDFGCYWFHVGPMNFEEAKYHCRSVGATLVWVQSHDEMVFLAGQALQTPQVTAWMTGLHTTAHQKDLNLYFWSSGSKVSFTAWSDLEPDHFRNERCVTMELKFGYRWNTVSCDQSHSFICKSDPPFFRLKNPILLGVLGVVSILLIILIFILCTMRYRPSSTCEDHVYCTQHSSCSKDRNQGDPIVLNRLPSQPSAPPVDDRYTTLPSSGISPGPYMHQTSMNDPPDHIYEDVDGHRRVKAQNSNKPDTSQHPQPANPYLMWA